jgi:hypothetical protein
MLSGSSVIIYTIKIFYSLKDSTLKANGYPYSMGQSYEKNKKHIHNWRVQNADKYREYDRAYKREKYRPSFNSEARRLRNIRVL